MLTIHTMSFQVKKKGDAGLGVTCVYEQGQENIEPIFD